MTDTATYTASFALHSVSVDIVRVPGAEDLPLPAYKTEGAAGLDLYAAVDQDVVLASGQSRRVSTGIRLAVPPGFEAQVRPRSGLAAEHGVTLLNAPGTVDSDFRGIVQAIVINHGHAPFTIRRGDRIAQLVVAPVVRVVWREQADLTPSARGAGGFGSTGTR
jgi:dUTP pyrophosphatase